MASSPQPKKLKMSTSSCSSAEEADTTAGLPSTCIPSDPTRRRYKRRKIAIFLSYCGAGYQGMQKNPNVRTIEGDLEEALFLAGAVPEHDRGNPKRYDWARSARTDKGVSASGQVVSGRFYIDPPGLVDRLNNVLVDQIRIMGYKRVTSSFNAKKYCDRRRYIYLLPVFALDPNAHPNRESVMASLGSENVLGRCLECSERGRKVVGIIGRQSKSLKEVESSDLGLNEAGVSVDVKMKSSWVSEVITDEAKTESIPGEVKHLGVILSFESMDVEREAAAGIEASLSEGQPMLENKISAGSKEPDSNVLIGTNGCKKEGAVDTYCFGDKERERFTAILKRYEGTHNFHNFTTRTKAYDPSARRYIISFNADSVVSIEGIDFIKCEVVGQSFMLHQIRKMIGLAVGVMRNCAPASVMDIALKQDVDINVPTAPEVGLYLDECFFSSYNKKWKESHEELSMEAYAGEVEEFKLKHIYSHVAATERKEGAVALWLHSLNHRSFPDFLLAELKEEPAIVPSSEVDNVVLE